jgi:hypothetical protein
VGARHETLAGRLTLLSVLVMVLACATPPEASNQEIVDTYRLFRDGGCAELHSRGAQIDWSVREPTRKPFFDLMQGYCLELDGGIEAASALYAIVVADAPSTRQAYEASLRLGEIRRLAVEGATREQLDFELPD